MSARTLSAQSAERHCFSLSVAPGAMARTPAYPEYGSQGMASPWMHPADAHGGGGGSRPTSTTNHASSWSTVPYSREAAGPGSIISASFPPYSHTTPPPTAVPGGWNAHPDRNSDLGSSSWGAYPPPSHSQQQHHQQPFSPMTAGYSGGDSRSSRTTPVGSIPSADMYPPLQGMDQHSPPQQPGSATSYGSWGSQSAYPPLGSVKNENISYGNDGGWYSQSEGGHSTPALEHSLPVTEGYYTQR